MPEGPEIHRLARYIREHVEGKTVTAVEFGPSKHHGKESIYEGLTIEQVEPRGKSITFHFSDGWSMFTHTQLYGKWYVHATGQPTEGSRKVGVVIHTPDHRAGLYSSGRVDVLRTEDIASHSFLSSLGPDVLDMSVTTEDIAAILRRKANDEIGKLMLDQSVFAGVGNYLRSEILFLTGLRPERRPNTLSDDQLENLASSILSVSRRSFTSEGFTTSDEHIEQGYAQGKDRKALKRYVYKHAGEPCPMCGTTLQQYSYKKRKVFFCPSCQPA